jgi:hypothetical protein
LGLGDAPHPCSMHYIPENAHNQVPNSADLLMYADWQKDVKDMEGLGFHLFRLHPMNFMLSKTIQVTHFVLLKNILLT